MERIITTEDRIRRAEEIYNRKKTQNGRRVNTKSYELDKKEKINFHLFKRMLLQIAISIMIYLILFLIKNSNYIFSENVINKTKKFLSYDINVKQIYDNMLIYYKYNIKPFIEKYNNRNNDDNDTSKETLINGENNENLIIDKEENVIVNEVEKNTIETNIEKNEEELDGIGGGEEKTSDENVDDEKKEEIKLSQMEIDANEIKEKYSLMVPLIGTITSRYGPRTPTKIVSANHTGIDIAVNEGTVFVAAMDGKVITASSYGSYGNHIFIENGDVITVYAHCKKLYVKEGEYVLKGQKIGEVGQTR